MSFTNDVMPVVLKLFDKLSTSFDGFGNKITPKIPLKIIQPHTTTVTMYPHWKCYGYEIFNHDERFHGKNQL